MTYRRFVESAIVELADWCAAEASTSDATDFYDSVRCELELLQGIEEPERLAARVKMLGRMIIDSGPLTADFIPSFHALADAIGRLERRKRRE